MAATVKKRVARFVRRVLGLGDEFISVGQMQAASRSAGKIGQGLHANVIMSPVQWIQRTFTQAVPIVERMEGRLWRWTPSHPVADLLMAPNPFYDGTTLVKGLILSWLLDGNAYVLKERNALRGVVQLWYVPHWLIEPQWPQDGSAFITHYAYRPIGGVKVDLPVADVVHLRDGIDPENPRKGLSSLRAVLKEVLTDEEASAFSAYILENMGVPGGVISPKSSEALPDDEDVNAMKEHMQTAFTGKNRGRWLVVGAPTEISQFGFDPNRLMLGPLRDISEERVCSALGVPAAVVGFGSGLQQTKVGATMRELVRLARVQCIEPMQTAIGRQLTRQLLPEFDQTPLTRIAFDNTNVPMFAEDETERATRAAKLVTSGIIRVDQAQEMVGAEVDPQMKIYYRPSNVTVVTPGEEPVDPPSEPGNRVAAILNGKGE